MLLFWATGAPSPGCRRVPGISAVGPWVALVFAPCGCSEDEDRVPPEDGGLWGVGGGTKGAGWFMSDSETTATC